MPSLVTPDEYAILLTAGALCLIGAFVVWAIRGLFKR
jgi:hypothetical protein